MTEARRLSVRTLLVAIAAMGSVGLAIYVSVLLLADDTFITPSWGVAVQALLAAGPVACWVLVRRPRAYFWVSVAYFVSTLTVSAMGGFYLGSHLYLIPALILLFTAMIDPGWAPRVTRILRTTGVVVLLTGAVVGATLLWNNVLRSPTAFNVSTPIQWHEDGIREIQDAIFAIEGVAWVGTASPPYRIEVWWERGTSREGQLRIRRQLLKIPEVTNVEWCRCDGFL
jgi:hypothetical protein